MLNLSLQEIDFQLSIKDASLIFLGSLLLTGCKDSLEDTPSPIIPSESQELINTSLYGRVIDEVNAPVAGALITYKSGESLSTTETDDDGYYFLENLNNRGKSAYLTVQATGKFEAFRRLSILPNRFNYTEVKINNKTSIGKVNAQIGGSLTHASSAVE